LVLLLASAIVHSSQRLFRKADSLHRVPIIPRTWKNTDVCQRFLEVESTDAYWRRPAAPGDINA
jgi:hypothetical protein